MVLDGVLEQFGQLQRVLADLLDRSEQEAVDGDVDHLLDQATSLEEVLVASVPHQSGQLHAGVHMVVTVFRVYPEAILLWDKTWITRWAALRTVP